MKKFILTLLLVFLVAFPSFAQQYVSDIIMTGTGGIWTDERSYSTLADALTALGSSHQTLLISEEVPCTTATINANTKLKFVKTGAIANTGQLTINTRDIIAEDRQIFTGTGDIDFAEGSVVRSAWFGDIVDAFDLTNDDYVTLVVSKQDHIIADCAVGNDVTLKWESPRNRIIADSGFTLSNIKNIEAGDYQLFAGAGDFDFLDGAKLKLSWFNRLRSVLTWVEDELVTIVISGDNTVSYSQTSTTNEILDFNSMNGRFTVSPGVVLTIYSPENVLAGLRQYIFAGTGTIQFTMPGVVYPGWYEEDPYTNGFEAINEAVRSIIGANNYWGHGEVHIPGGDYTIDTTGVFSDTDDTYNRGLNVTGDGWTTTRLILNPSGSDLYFYNNVATARWQFATFSDIAFIGLSDWSSAAYGDISQYTKGFRLYSTAATGNHEQAFRFNRCWFSCLDTAFESDGSQTTSEDKFFDCRFEKIKDVIFNIDNLQFENLEIFGTDMHNIYGDVFRIGSSGGGTIKVFGGSIITDSDSGSDEYIIDIPVAAATGRTSLPIIINGIRFELRGNNTKFIYNPGATGSLEVSVNDCCFISTSTAVKSDWVSISNYKEVTFSRCIWNWDDPAYYEGYNITSAAKYGLSGRIKWIDCKVHDDLSEHISFGSTFGHASAVRCGSEIGVSSYIISNDFDLFGYSVGHLLSDLTDPNVPLKTVPLGNATYAPYNNTNEIYVKLPKNAIIKAIRVIKPALGTSSSDYCLHVGNDDKSICYVSSVPEDQRYTHRIDYERNSQTYGQLTTRTDNDTGVVTLYGGNNSISEADSVNVNWVVTGTAGKRREMTVTAISMAVQGYITISLDGGSGDNLPAANSDLVLTSDDGFIDVGATDNERIVRLWSSNGDKTTAGGNEASHPLEQAIVEYY